MTTKKRRKYTAEFKREALGRVTEQENPVAETARNLGLNQSILGRWVREQAGQQGGAFPGKGKLTPGQEELRRLRAENKRLKMGLTTRLLCVHDPTFSIGYKRLLRSLFRFLCGKIAAYRVMRPLCRIKRFQEGIFMV